MLVTGLLSACSSAPQPGPTASAYLAAWARQDWAAMRQLTSDPPADFTSVNQAAFTDLSVRTASFTAGTIKTTGKTAAGPITERLTLAGLGTVTIRSQLHLVQVQGHWLVSWSPPRSRRSSSRATTCRCRRPGRPGRTSWARTERR